VVGTLFALSSAIDVFQNDPVAPSGRMRVKAARRAVKVIVWAAASVVGTLAGVKT